MQWQQSLSECGEEEGDCRWLQESALSACSSDHQWCDRGESEQHQVPGCYTSQRNLSWTNNTAALAKKAQQHLYFLRKLRRARAPAPIMCTFYRGTNESILTSCITVWYGACNSSCRKSLQRIVESSWEDRWCLSPLPPGHLQHPSHPQSPLHYRWYHPPDTQLLQSATIREETAESPGQDHRLKDSFIHQGVRKLNSLPSLPPPPLSYTTHHWTLTPLPPTHHTHPPTPHPPTHTHTHIHTHCDQHQSLCTALDWPHSTTSSDSLNKDCSLFVTLNRIE